MVSPPLIVDDSIYKNRVGAVKLIRVKENLDVSEGFTKDVLDEIKRLYVEFRDTIEVLPMRLTYEETMVKDLKTTSAGVDNWISFFNNSTGRNAWRFNDVSNIVCFKGRRKYWVLKESCKRGNDVYIRLVKNKIQPLIDAAEKQDPFFSTVVNKNRKRIKKTRLLYVTGTVAHRFCIECNNPIPEKSSCCDKCGSMLFKKYPIDKAYNEFGKQWNRWNANIRSCFGKISYIRTWQSQKNGYPHFHALIYFHGKKFTAVRWVEKQLDKNGKPMVSWRVHNRQKHNGVLIRDHFKNAWRWGNLDIKCCDSTEQGLRDLLKYVTRELEGGESDLTNSLLWYFRKQSFAISRDFFKLFNVKKTSLEPSDDDLIKAEGFIKSNNSNSKLVSIEVFPIIMRDCLPKYKQLVLNNFDIEPEPPPDLPPEIENFLLGLDGSCEVSSIKKKLLDDGSSYMVIVYKYRNGVD